LSIAKIPWVIIAIAAKWLAMSYVYKASKAIYNDILLT
jgi:hypothetical protein